MIAGPETDQEHAIPCSSFAALIGAVRRTGGVITGYVHSWIDEEYMHEASRRVRRMATRLSCAAESGRIESLTAPYRCSCSGSATGTQNT